MLFECDRDLFISMFCENIDRPELKCNGQCAMAKMEKEQREEEAANRLKQLQTETVVFSCHKSIPLISNTIVTVRFIPQSYYSDLYTFLHCKQINKPPQAA